METVGAGVGVGHVGEEGEGGVVPAHAVSGMRSFLARRIHKGRVLRDFRFKSSKNEGGSAGSSKNGGKTSDSSASGGETVKMKVDQLMLSKW